MADRANGCSDILQEAENKLNVTFPTYLKNLLKVNGFDNYLVLSTLTDKDIENIETFAREGLPWIIPSSEYQEYYGIFSKHVRQFKFVCGHKKLIWFLKKFCEEYRLRLNADDDQEELLTVGSPNVSLPKKSKRSLN